MKFLSDSPLQQNTKSTRLSSSSPGSDLFLPSFIFLESLYTAQRILGKSQIIYGKAGFNKKRSTLHTVCFFMEFLPLPNLFQKEGEGVS